jgi:hypothetical protein
MSAAAKVLQVEKKSTIWFNFKIKLTLKVISALKRESG